MVSKQFDLLLFQKVQIGHRSGKVQEKSFRQIKFTEFTANTDKIHEKTNLARGIVIKSTYSLLLLGRIQFLELSDQMPVT